MGNFFVGSMLVLDVAVLALTIYFTWSQGVAWRDLAAAENLPPEDHIHFRNQIWRRLAGCLLLVAAVGLHAGWFLLGLDGHVTQLMEAGQRAREGGAAPVMNDEQRHALQGASIYLIINLLVLLGLFLLAAIDLLATRRFALRHQTRIINDRRAMLSRQIERLRAEHRGESD